MNPQKPQEANASQPEAAMHVTEHVATRPATDSDADFARDVHHRAYHDVVVRQFGSWDDAAQDQFFANTWENPGFQVISYDGEQCGYVRVEETPEEIRGHELVLLPDFQGKGIGSAILEAWKEKARSRGVPAKLQVLKANKAKELYERFGFKAVGQTDTHYEMEWNPDDE